MLRLGRGTETRTSESGLLSRLAQFALDQRVCQDDEPLSLQGCTGRRSQASPYPERRNGGPGSQFVQTYDRARRMSARSLPTSGGRLNGMREELKDRVDRASSQLPWGQRWQRVRITRESRGSGLDRKDASQFDLVIRRSWRTMLGASPLEASAQLTDSQHSRRSSSSRSPCMLDHN